MVANKRNHIMMVFLTAMILIFGSYVSSLSTKNNSPYLYIVDTKIDSNLCIDISCEYDYLPGQYVLSRDSIEQIKKIENVEKIYFEDYFPKNFYNDGTFVETDTIVTLNEPVINDKFIPIKKLEDVYTFMSVDFPKEFYERNGNVDLSYYSYQYEAYDFNLNIDGYPEITIPKSFASQFKVIAGDTIDLNVIKTNSTERINTTKKYYIRAIFDSAHAPFEVQNKIFINKVNTDIIYDKDLLTEVYKKRYLDVSNGDIKEDIEQQIFLKDFKSFMKNNNTDYIKAYIVTKERQDISEELRKIFPYNKISKKSLLKIGDIYSFFLIISIICFLVASFFIKNIAPFKIIIDMVIVYFFVMCVQYIYVGYTFHFNYVLGLIMILILYGLWLFKKRRNK